MHYEGELCFIVKDNRLAGVGFGLDLTKRTLQSSLKEQGLPWERSKAFDGSAVFSEFVAIPANITELSLVLYIDDHIIQQGGYSEMIHKPEALMANINSFMSLVENDVIMTGTPSGVGKIKKGQVFIGKVYAGKHCLISQQWTVM